MRFSVIAVLALSFSAPAMAEPKPGPAAAAPARVVPPARLSAALSFEKPSILLREPAFFFFKVSNAEDKPVFIDVGGDYRNATGRPGSFRVTVAKENGEVAIPTPAGWNMGGLVSAPPIPAHGDYTFTLLLPDWARITSPGRYVVTAKRKVRWYRGDPFKAGNAAKPESGVMELEAHGTVTVLPDDDAAMVRLMGEWGTALLAKDDSWAGAEKRLRSLYDLRLAPYYVKLYASDDYSRRFAALTALGQYGDTASLKVLESALAPDNKDVNLRRAAANSLARNPNSQAIAALLQHHDDPEMGVRLTIVHFLGRRRNPADLKMLEGYLKDADPAIQKEAQRYLAMTPPAG